MHTHVTLDNRLCKVYYNSTCQRWRYGGQGRRLLSVEISMMVIVWRVVHTWTHLCMCGVDVWHCCPASGQASWWFPSGQWRSARSAVVCRGEASRAPCVLSRCSPSGYIREGANGQWVPAPMAATAITTPVLFPYSTSPPPVVHVLYDKVARQMNGLMISTGTSGKKATLVSCD
jgi:hypothetical protein